MTEIGNATYYYDAFYLSLNFFLRGIKNDREWVGRFPVALKYITYYFVDCGGGKVLTTITAERLNILQP
jgi:hypothetical protein